MTRFRRPLCGPVGPYIVASLCLWEIFGLIPRVPIPPLTTIVRQQPAFGVAILLALTHHWFLEIAATSTITLEPS